MKHKNVNTHTQRETETEREIKLIKLYFSTVKILAQRPTHISAVVTVLLITKIFIVKIL